MAKNRQSSWIRHVFAILLANYVPRVPLILSFFRIFKLKKTTRNCCCCCFFFLFHKKKYGQLWKWNLYLIDLIDLKRKKKKRKREREKKKKRKFFLEKLCLIDWINEKKRMSDWLTDWQLNELYLIHNNCNRWRLKSKHLKTTTTRTPAVFN